eukprot:Em0004g727a
MRPAFWNPPISAAATAHSSGAVDDDGVQVSALGKIWFPKEKGTRPRRLNSPIKKVSNQSSQISSGEAVLGELNVCKSKCKDLEKKMLSLEEERDTLYAQCARGRTKIMELQGLFQNAKEELEKNAANLEVLTRNQMDSFLGRFDAALRLFISDV